MHDVKPSIIQNVASANIPKWARVSMLLQTNHMPQSLFCFHTLAYAGAVGMQLIIKDFGRDMLPLEFPETMDTLLQGFSPGLHVCG